MAEKATYVFGHHTSAVSSHARRTAQDSAAFLLPHLKPHFTILDIGCGPGTITADFAQLVPQGKVTGVDAVESVLQTARAHVKMRGITNCVFEVADANALQYADASFDVVFCHQVLQHVNDQVGILKEMLRVAKPGGIVAAREVDYKGFSWYPELPGLEKWQSLYLRVAQASGGQPAAGRYIQQWAKDAGFEREHLTMSWSSWFYTGEAAQRFGESWEGRYTHSNLVRQTLDHSIGTQADVDEVSATWKDWSTKENRFIAIPNGEILYQVPETSA